MTEDPNFYTLLTLASRAMAKRVNEALRPHGLAPAQYAVLDLLENDAPLYPKTMARRLEIESSTMATTLNRMERDGLVFRKQDPNDRRGTIIEITDKAKSLVEPARQAIREIETEVLEDLDPETREAVLRGLSKSLRTMKTIS